MKFYPQQHKYKFDNKTKEKQKNNQKHEIKLTRKPIITSDLKKK